MTTWVMPVDSKWGESYLLDMGSDIDVETARRILNRAIELFEERDDRIAWVPHTSELLFRFEGTEIADFRREDYPESDELVEWRREALERAFSEVTETTPRPIGNKRGPRPTGRKRQKAIALNIIEGMTIEDLDAKLATMREKALAFLNS